MKKLRTFFVCIFMAVHTFSSVFASSGELSSMLAINEFESGSSGALIDEMVLWTDAFSGSLSFPDAAITGTDELRSTGITLTGTMNSIGATESSGTVSNSGLTDTIPPIAIKLAYFDDNHNSRVDRLEITNSETMTGNLDVSKIEIYSAANGLNTSKINTLPGYVTSAKIRDNIISLNIREQDMIRPSLNWNDDTSSDIRVHIPNSAGLTDLAGNTHDPWLKITHDYSKYDGVVNNMGSITMLDIGNLYGRYFSGALGVQRIDSRWMAGSLILSGIVLTVSDDSFLGDGNVLQLGRDSRLQGGAMLTFGTDSKILGDTNEVLFSKNSFRSAFSDTASGTHYDYVGTIVGSGIELSVDYVASGSTFSVYSGALVNHVLMSLPSGMTGWVFRATVSRKFLPGSRFSGMTFIFDSLSSNVISVPDEEISIISTGSITDITDSWATLSGVVVKPGMPGQILYGTGEFIHTGVISSGAFAFSGLLSDTQYFYRLAFKRSGTGWILYSDTGSFRTLPASELPPKPVFVFQGPTYLTSEDATLDAFTCDNIHSDCKINFDLSPSFGTGAPSRLFSCELDFGLPLPSEEENKCNPNAIVFPRGQDYTVRFRIISRDDPARISERIILVHAPVLGSDNSTGSTSSGSITIADPEIGIQSWLDTERRCREKDCSINLLYVPRHPKEACMWTFGSGSYATGTELQCNPGYVHYGTGQFVIALRVYEKNHPGNFRESNLVIYNPPSAMSGGTSGPPSNNVPSIQISDPEIIIQSGLNTSRQCNKKDCALNLSYKAQWPKEACLWFFPGGAYASGTENKCNPGYVHYGIGEFLVTLRVYEQGNVSNFREKTLLFSNGTEKEILEEKEHPTNRAPVALIKLQGSLGKTKTQDGKSVTCHGVAECSINLSGDESYDTNRGKLAYAWNMWNGITSDKENPVAVKYTVGSYYAVLRVTDLEGLWSEDNFTVIVEGKNMKEKTNVPIDPNTISLKITGVSPNPLGPDGVSEWAEISNILSVDVSLAGCTLDDDPTKWSKVYHFSDDAILRANSKKRYYKLQTSINFNNTNDSANLSCGGRLISSLPWNYSVPEGFIVAGQIWPYSERIRTRVIRVVDGDTIVAMVYGKEEKIRLIGVDTPETVDPRKNVQYFGKEASSFTKRMLEWQEVELEFDYEPRDKYDRLLAYAWIGGVNFNSELIKLGYARAYLRFPFRYFKDFEKIGKESQKNKLGMWSDNEMVEILKAGIKEDKELLKEQLEKEDAEILEELIEVAEEKDMELDGLDQELFDSLFKFDEEVDFSSKIRTTKKYASVRSVIEGRKMDEIRIELQGKLSKNRLMVGWVFVCHTKTTCNVNFTAGKVRKNTVYFWEFGNGKDFYGANPLTQKYAIGKYKVHLRILDSESGELHDEYFSIAVKKLVTVKKKIKPKKVKVPSIKKEKPLMVREQLPFGQKSTAPTSESAVSALLLLMVFLSGGYAIVRKKLRKEV